VVSVPRADWEWFGHHGHLIVGRDCRFHLCTKVGPWLVSTVGEYLPDETSREIHADVRGIELKGRGDDRLADFMEKCGWVSIGAGRTYEMMVFPVSDERCDKPDCGCGLPKVTDWSEHDSDGYNDAGSATRGHYAMCERYAEVPGQVPA
jgi:hypothetical protein